MSDEKKEEVGELILKSKESTALVKFKERFFTPIEKRMTQLLHYEILKKDLVAVDAMSEPMYMRDFNKAFEILSVLICRTEEEYEKAITDRKHEEAKAVLERAEKYFEENKILNNGIKDSVKLREIYGARDEWYLEAKDKENFLKAFLKYLQNMQESFKMAHDDAKKIYDKTSNSKFEGIPSGDRNHN